MVFYAVPPGEYLLNITAERPDDATAPMNANLQIERGHPSWLNWLLLQIVLLIVPLVGWWRLRSFESDRWADSDHPSGPGSSSDDDDDDDDQRDDQKSTCSPVLRRCPFSASRSTAA